MTDDRTGLEANPAGPQSGPPLCNVRLTDEEAERICFAFRPDAYVGEMYRAVEQIVADRMADARAEAWDRLCNWLDAHDDSDVRASVKRAARDTNPYRKAATE